MVEIFAQRWSKPRGNSNEEGCLIDVISFRRVHRDETCISRVKFKIQPLIISSVETKRSHSPFLFDHVEKTKRNEWKEVRRAFGVNEKRARRIYRKIMWYSKPSRPFSPPFFCRANIVVQLENVQTTSPKREFDSRAGRTRFEHR